MKILFGIDSSPCSLAAIDLLGSLPWARAAEWRLVSVVQVPAMVYVAPEMAATQAFESFAAEARDRECRLAALSGDLAGRGIRARVSIEEEWDAGSTLTRIAREEGADLLVVGSHGRGDLERLLLGSVATHAALHAPCDVLVVKAPPRRAGRMTLMLAVDESVHARAAVEFVRGNRWPAGTHVELVSAMPAGPRRAGAEEWKRILELQAHRDLLCDYEVALRDAGLSASSSVPSGDPKSELERLAADLEPDLVIVGSHGRTGLSRLPLGSVSTHVLQHVPRSVLIVRQLDRD